MDIQLPDRCFVSHSYGDEASIRRLRQAKPQNVELDLFPREDPDASRPISDDIIPRILAGDGLIYLIGGESERSDWVLFERDFALRAGKPVFAFDPDEAKFFPEDDLPLDLRVQLLVSEGSSVRARNMLDWMRDQRNFELTEVKLAHRIKDIPAFFEDVANARQLLLVLVDDETADFNGWRWQLEHEDLVSEMDVPDDWWPPPTLYARIDSRWEPEVDSDPEVASFAKSEGMTFDINVDLVENPGDAGINWNRVDDLIVLISRMLAD